MFEYNKTVNLIASDRIAKKLNKKLNETRFGGQIAKFKKKGQKN